MWSAGGARDGSVRAVSAHHAAAVGDYGPRASGELGARTPVVGPPRARRAGVCAVREPVPEHPPPERQREGRAAVVQPRAPCGHRRRARACLPARPQGAGRSPHAAPPTSMLFEHSVSVRLHRFLLGGRPCALSSSRGRSMHAPICRASSRPTYSRRTFGIPVSQHLDAPNGESPRAQILHCDIKSGNILLGRGGVAKIAGAPRAPPRAACMSCPAQPCLSTSAVAPGAPCRRSLVVALASRCGGQSVARASGAGGRG